MRRDPEVSRAGSCVTNIVGTRVPVDYTLVSAESPEGFFVRKLRVGSWSKSCFLPRGGDFKMLRVRKILLV
jgi:hypothetical protein